MIPPRPFPYADLLAFMHRHLGVCEELTPQQREGIARHLAGNLSQIADVYYKEVKYGHEI